MYGSQKDMGNIFNLLQKEQDTQKGGGVPQKRGGSNPGGNYDIRLSGWYNFAILAGTLTIHMFASLTVSNTAVVI